VFAVVAVALLMCSLDQTAVAVALPTISTELGADLAWTSWVVTATPLGLILALPTAGRIVEIAGGRRVFLFGVGAFAAVSGISAASDDIVVLVVCRAVLGAISGLVLPVASAIVADCFGRDRDRALALFSTIFPVGAIAGPVVGALVLETWSWRGIFLVNAPLGLVLAGLGYFLIASPPRSVPVRVDLLGTALLLVALASLMAVVAVAGGGAPDEGTVVVLLALGLSASGAGLWLGRHIRRRPDAVIPRRLLVGGGLGRIHVVNLAIGAAATGYSAVLPLYVHARYGMSPLIAGSILTLRAAGTLAASVVTVVLLRALGHRPLISLGLGLTVVGLVLSALPPLGEPVLWMAAGAMCTGLGVGLCAPALNNAGMHLVHDAVTAISRNPAMAVTASSSW